MLGLMRLGSYCCKCEPPTSVKRVAGFIDLAALIAVPLIITLAGNKIPMGPLNKLVEPFGVGAKYGLFFIVTPVGGAVLFVIYKTWKSKDSSEPLVFTDVTNEELQTVLTLLKDMSFSKSLVYKGYYSTSFEIPSDLKKERLRAVLQFLQDGDFINSFSTISNYVQIIIDQEELDIAQKVLFRRLDSCQKIENN